MGAGSGWSGALLGQLGDAKASSQALSRTEEQLIKLAEAERASALDAERQDLAQQLGSLGDQFDIVVTERDEVQAMANERRRLGGGPGRGGRPEEERAALEGRVQAADADAATLAQQLAEQAAQIEDQEALAQQTREWDAAAQQAEAVAEADAPRPQPWSRRSRRPSRPAPRPSGPPKPSSAGRRGHRAAR